MIPPNEPIGHSSLASWCRKLLRWCRSIELQSGVGYRVRKSTGGATLDFDFVGGASTPATSKVELMQLISLESLDVLVCRPDDGDSGGADDVKVASQPELRTTIASEVIPLVGGGTETWSYSGYTTASQSRTAASGALSYTEVIVPRYITGQKIAVFDCDNTGVTAADSSVLTKITLSGRAWAEENSE